MWPTGSDRLAVMTARNLVVIRHIWAAVIR